MTTVYATQADVYKYGLPRGALGNPGRLAASAPASTSTVELIEHSFSLGDSITFRTPDGDTSAALPSPLLAGVIYYAVPVTDSTFRVSTTPDGLSLVTFTTDGASVIVTADLPWAALLEFYSRWVEGFLPAHAVPLAAPYPITIVGIVAQLVAKRAQILSGLVSESMNDTEAAAAKQLERFAQGIPVRDVAATQVETNLAVKRACRDDRIGRWSRWPGGPLE
jgi:hypothetical protein